MLVEKNKIFKQVKSLIKNMTKKNKVLYEEIQKNPDFIKEINKFIKATTRVYKLP